MSVILKTRQFTIKIYEVDHPPAHCHVIFKDGSQVRVALPLIEPMDDAIISKTLRKTIEDKLEKLLDEWERLHPKKHNKSKY